MKKKILVTDGLSEDATKILSDKYSVESKSGLSVKELKEIIGQYEAIIIRSATKLTKDIINFAQRLEVIGRVGVGVDNVDLTAATKKGILVVNAPGSNSVSVAEHTIGLMMSLARKIPEANSSTQSGKWEKSRFKGIEVEGKTLGVIGFGKIGFLVAKKSLGLGLKVIAFDPFASDERFNQLGVKRAQNIEDIYKVADFLTIHLPKNKETVGMFDKEELKKIKEGAIIINAARGGIIVEDDLAQLMEEGHIRGAALDVFSDEPCKDSPLFGFENVVCTPHLGASTTEAQDRAGMMIAEQIDAVFSGKVAPFVVNIPAVGSETMEAISPYFDLASNMGSLFSSLFKGSLDEIEVGFYGKLSGYDTSMLTSMILVKIFSKYSSEDINVVNVKLIVEELGIKIKETKSSQSRDYINLIELKGIGNESELSISGTITGKKNKPRFISIDKFAIDMVPSKHMVFIRYKDIPGQIGKIGTAFGTLGLNISSMHVGRKKLGGDAVMGLNVDNEITQDMLDEFKKLTGYDDIKVVNLD